MKIKVLFVQLVFCLFIVSCLGQSKIDSKELSHIDVSNIKFDITLKEKKVKAGKTIELNALIQNNSSQNISTLPFYIDDLSAFYVIEILNSKGEKLERKDIPNIPRAGSRTAIDFMVDEKFETTLQLNKFYNLPVGTYRVTASFIALSQYGRERVIINSNLVTFSVIN